ncbi:MbtH family protein [Nocardia sp. CNY236]|uniref:MbtH family protein n=1 Tax=Nocardia sp. CNY236 TaxID=1169152 RepID=UPI000403BBE4|nr:MbtH family protein [Nocardia sp. CNY236]
MDNRFDNDEVQFYVLVNAEGDHSLWPVFAAVPGGWTVAYGATDRAACLRYVQMHWRERGPHVLIDVISSPGH